MDAKKNGRIKTEIDDKKIRISTTFEETQRRVTEYDKDDNVDNNALAEMIRLKAEFLSLNEKKYRFNRILSTQGGEGVVAVCDSDEYGEVAVKVYLDVRDVKLEKRQKIIQFTNSEEAEKYVLPIIDFGFIEFDSKVINYFEVQPFCKDGDLSQKGKFEYEELIDLIKDLNEALHFIHENGFLHMDIKPENIYVYNNHYVLGDFGITRELKEGRAGTRITHIGKIVSGTPGYEAPETRLSYGMDYVLSAKTDYYALAVTIASLYVGHFVFANEDGDFNAGAFYDAQKKSKIDLKNTNDKRTLFLQNLIDGMFQKDEEFRFDYADVCKWLCNPNYKGGLEKVSKGRSVWSSPFQGSSKKELLYTERDLFNWIVYNWEDAKKRLYRHDFVIHFQKNNEAFVASAIEDIVEIKYPDGKNGDKALFEMCLLIYSEMDTPLVWRGEKWNGLQILADDILSADKPEFYSEIFENKLISMWLEQTGLLANDDNQMKLIVDIEEKAKINSYVATYWFAYTYASKQEMQIRNRYFNSPIEIIDICMDSPVIFYAEHGYLECLQDIDKSYYIWGFICSGGVERLGCAEYVYTYLNAEDTDLTKKVHLLFVLFEQIGIALNQERVVDKIRNTYLKYGPYGDITYIHSLVKSIDYYYSDDKDGIEILDDIRKHKDICIGTVSEMGKELLELKKMTDKLYARMQNNPLLAKAGIYDRKSIKCRNLQGYFLYQFLNREVPLGYRKLVEDR